MKSVAKHIVQSMESPRDRVALMTFPHAMWNTVYTLNSSGVLARQQLLEDIMALSSTHGHPALLPQCQGSNNGRYWTIEDNALKPDKISAEDRSVHLFLLTSQLGHGAIDLLPDVLMR